MKKLFVFVPASLLVLFLLNSFVVKEKEAGEKPTKATKPGLSNVVLRSTDGGQTWQDISKGLPENLQKSGVWSFGLFANDRGLYVRAGNGVYLNEANSTTSSWTKDNFPGQQIQLTPGNNGIIAYNFRGQFLEKTNGKSSWSPMYTNFQEQAVRLNGTVDWMYKNFKEKQVSSVFETAGGTVLVGSNNAVYRSANGGKTWEYVRVGGWVMKMIESDGVLLAAGSRGILKSTDDGKNWERVINEGGTGVAVERIDGGFAAIAYNILTQTNTIHISQDNGKTWKEIGQGPMPSLSSSLFALIGGSRASTNIFSIKQVGKYLIGSRPDGIFQSADMGKTWKLLLPSEDNRGFNLHVSGNVIYALPNKGC